MHILVYDGSFAGFFSAVFESYRLHLSVQDICVESHYVEDMFCERLDVETDMEHFARIERGIKSRVGNDIFGTLHKAFLSETPGVEKLLFNYLKRLFDDKQFAAKNPLSQELMPIFQLARSVMREYDLYLGMVRFQKVDDSLYVARIIPKYNIAAMLAPHFKSRLPDQKWLIFDEKRQYGMYYDLQTVAEVEIENFKLPEDSSEFALGWQAYYKAATIKERINPKCHRTMLPGCYWDALLEKRQNLHSV